MVKKKDNTKWLVLGVIFVLLVLVGGLGIFIYKNNNGENQRTCKDSFDNLQDAIIVGERIQEFECSFSNEILDSEKLKIMSCDKPNIGGFIPINFAVTEYEEKSCSKVIKDYGNILILYKEINGREVYQADFEDNPSYNFCSYNDKFIITVSNEDLLEKYFDNFCF